MRWNQDSNIDNSDLLQNQLNATKYITWCLIYICFREIKKRRYN